MSKAITITLQGEFEEWELIAMVTLLRTIDDKHPDRQYNLFVHDPENSLADAEEALRRYVAPRSNRETKITVHRRQ